jgi:cystathionine beta-lyase family protein involved in aluminum resistance
MIPGYEKLSESQQQRVFDAFERGYNHSKHMGVNIAVGTGYETAKLALAEELKSIESKVEEIPPSIFAGLDNCY